MPASLPIRTSFVPDQRITLTIAHNAQSIAHRVRTRAGSVMANSMNMVMVRLLNVPVLAVSRSCTRQVNGVLTGRWFIPVTP